MRVPHSVPTQTPQWLIEARQRAGKLGYPHLEGRPVPRGTTDLSHEEVLELDRRHAIYVAEDMAAATEPTDQRVTYRGYIITYDPPPIADRRWDWHFLHEQFDGAPDAGDNRYGDAASLTDCFHEIDALEDGQ